jgi:dienelactone hydrolase
MIAPLAKFIDWSSIQVVTMRCRDDGRNLRLEEALQFLKGLDFIPAESQPARVEFNGPLHFRFPTPRPCAFAENNVVYGRLYRCAERWQERPVIVLLHGQGGEPDYHFRFPLIARRCNRAGFNTATLVEPYHFQRAPPQFGAFSIPNHLLWAQSLAQAVAEIRALAGWLLGEGCPAVALWGISLGGGLAGLAVCRDARLASVVLTVPAVRLNLSIAERVIWRRIREAWQGQRAAWEALNLTALNLTSAQPAIPKDNILLIEAIHDLMAPKEAIEELWQVWGQPDIWRLPHGHVSWMGVPGFTNRVLRWLAPRLDAPAARTGQSLVLPH